MQKAAITNFFKLDSVTRHGSLTITGSGKGRQSGPHGWFLARDPAMESDHEADHVAVDWAPLQFPFPLLLQHACQLSIPPTL